jgi:hypothetical protein
MSPPSRFWLGLPYAAAISFAIVAGARGETLVAERVTAPNHLFSGTDTVGGVGDWYLSNGIVQAIVDDIGPQ